MCEKRIWWTEKGKTDKYGKQVYISVCLKDKSRMIAWSESYDAPTCGHPECKMKPWDKVEWK